MCRVYKSSFRLISMQKSCFPWNGKGGVHRRRYHGTTVPRYHQVRYEDVSWGASVRPWAWFLPQYRREHYCAVPTVPTGRHVLYRVPSYCTYKGTVHAVARCRYCTGVSFCWLQMNFMKNFGGICSHTVPYRGTVLYNGMCLSVSPVMSCLPENGERGQQTFSGTRAKWYRTSTYQVA